MTFTLPLPREWALQGWKVKIRGDERMEEPHATILRRTFGWRVSLRSGAFLDRSPDPREVPEPVVAHLLARLDLLRWEWDERYPENPVGRKAREEAFHA